jgi:single-stranded DNA-binding protein
MSNLGKLLVQGFNVRIAADPMFIPALDPKRHHAMVTVICNRGLHPRTKEQMTDEITLNFWGGYALTAAKYLKTGREISFVGELRSFRHQTGQVNTAGKAVINRRIEVLVNQFFFGKDSMKELSARVNGNIAILRAGGRIPANVILTAEELLVVQKEDAGDYNPAVHNPTGRYGNSRIWLKETNSWANPGAAQTAQTAQMSAAATNVDAAAELAALKAKIAGMEAAGETVSPFVGA